LGAADNLRSQATRTEDEDLRIVTSFHSPPSRRPDFKALYGKLEAALDRIEGYDNVSLMLSDILQMLVTEFREDLGFEGGRLYKRDGEEHVLCDGYGQSRNAPIGFRISQDYEPHRRTVEEGLLIMRPDDPAFDSEIEGAIGVSSTFAAIAVGEDGAHVLAFSVRGEVPEEQILYSLSAVRHVVNLKISQQRMNGIMEEARIIQESLLPPSNLSFDGYDIYGRSCPTEIVGGDFFDFLPLGKDLLGVAIGDAAGHGLPAALLARDVVTGLRVGMDEDLKVVRVIERLNRVIHRAALSSRFITLFYGEFGRDGSLIYCDAGNVPPLLQRGTVFEELDRGGLILGPNPQAHYERGFVHLDSGDTVVMFTDGITERAGATNGQFGVDRLRSLLLDYQGASAKTLVEAIFRAVEEHAGDIPSVDDMTAVVVRRL
jgi:sigma-B regulation protein RsbU (phosphoserine phosphatase)